MKTVQLENFDDCAPPEMPESADYRRGFADAQAAAADSDAARLAQSLGELSASLKDMSFGYEEARQVMLSRIAPVLNQVADLIVPEVLEATFGLHLIEVLKDATRKVSLEKVQVGLNAATLVRLEAEGLEIPPQFELIPDASLSSGQAAIFSEATPFLLDLTSLSDALKAALTAVEPTERSQHHG